MVFSTLARTESIREDNVTMIASVHISGALEHDKRHSSREADRMLWHWHCYMSCFRFLVVGFEADDASARESIWWARRFNIPR